MTTVRSRELDPETKQTKDVSGWKVCNLGALLSDMMKGKRKAAVVSLKSLITGGLGAHQCVGCCGLCCKALADAAYFPTCECTSLMLGLAIPVQWVQHTALLTSDQ